jgi:hypothetical protein
MFSRSARERVYGLALLLLPSAEICRSAGQSIVTDDSDSHLIAPSDTAPEA